MRRRFGLEWSWSSSVVGLGEVNRALVLNSHHGITIRRRRPSQEFVLERKGTLLGWGALLTPEWQMYASRAGFWAFKNKFGAFFVKMYFWAS